MNDRFPPGLVPYAPYGIVPSGTPERWEFPCSPDEARLRKFAAGYFNITSGTPGIREAVRVRPGMKEDTVNVDERVAIYQLDTYRDGVEALRARLEDPAEEELRRQIAETALWPTPEQLNQA